MMRADIFRLTPISQACWRLLPLILSLRRLTRRKSSKKMLVRQTNADILHVRFYLTYVVFAYADMQFHSL